MRPFTKQYQIPIVIDTRTGSTVFTDSVNELMDLPEIQSIRTGEDRERYVCYECHQAVKLNARKNRVSRLGHTYYFKHPPGVGEGCRWKTGALTPGQIYAGVQEGIDHYQMKICLKNTLEQLSDWAVVDVDRVFIFNDDRSVRGKPDIHARYRGQDVVFEVQLRSEDPRTLTKRKRLYQEKGWPLVWLSLGECIDGGERQIQKDMAFLSRGNGFVFNEALSRQSIEDDALMFLVKVWTPVIEGYQMGHQWIVEHASYQDLQYEKGEVFLVDTNKLYDDIRETLEKGRQGDILRELKNALPMPGEAHFKELASYKWPNRVVPASAQAWLSAVYKQEFEQRAYELKVAIIRYLASDDWQKRGSMLYWAKVAGRVSNMPFGIEAGQDLRIVEAVMVILGYEVRPDYRVSDQDYPALCRGFFEGGDKPYQALCRWAINMSVFRDQMLDHRQIRQWLDDPLPEGQQRDLDVFFRWFMGCPVPPTGQ